MQREFAFCLALAQVAGDEMNLGGEQDSSCAQKIVTGLSRIPQEGFFKGTSCCCVREWVKEDRQSKGIEYRKLEEKREDTMIHELFASEKLVIMMMATSCRSSQKAADHDSQLGIIRTMDLLFEEI